MKLWEIYVPCEKPPHFPGKKRFFDKKFHREWDKKVMAISNGLTILTPHKGSWVSPDGQRCNERVLPVRIACSDEEIELIIALTAKHYGQKAIMAYLVSETVIIRDFVVKSENS